MKSDTSLEQFKTKMNADLDGIQDKLIGFMHESQATLLQSNQELSKSISDFQKQFEALQADNSRMKKEVDRIQKELEKTAKQASQNQAWLFWVGGSVLVLGVSVLISSLLK